MIVALIKPCSTFLLTQPLFPEEVHALVLILHRSVMWQLKNLVVKYEIPSRELPKEKSTLS